MKLFVARDKRTGKYRDKRYHRNFDDAWTEDVNKARVFKSKTGAILSLGQADSLNTNPAPYNPRGGNKVILPDWVEIVPLKVSLDTC